MDKGDSALFHIRLPNYGDTRLNSELSLVSPELPHAGTIIGDAMIDMFDWIRNNKSRFFALLIVIGYFIVCIIIGPIENAFLTLYSNLVPLALIWFGNTLGSIFMNSSLMSWRGLWNIGGSLENDTRMPRDIVKWGRGTIIIICGWLLLVMFISLETYLAWFVKSA